MAQTLRFHIGTKSDRQRRQLIPNHHNDSNGSVPYPNGREITLNTGANLTINGGGALSLSVLNNNGGHIGTWRKYFRHNGRTSQAPVLLMP